MLHEKSDNTLYFADIKKGIFQIQCYDMDIMPRSANKLTNKSEKDYWEKEYSSISGHLSGLEIKGKKVFYDGVEEEREFLILTIVDKKETYLISIELKSGYTVSLLSFLPNIDFSKEFKLMPAYKVEGEKKLLNVFLFQEDENGKALPIKKYFTKENQNGVPAWQIHEYPNGSKEYDRSLQIHYLYDLCRKSIVKGTVATNDVLHKETMPKSIMAEVDDLPF